MANKIIKKLEVSLATEHQLIMSGAKFEVRPSETMEKDLAYKFSLATSTLKNAWTTELAAELALLYAGHLATRVELKTLYNNHGRLQYDLLQAGERFYGACQSICQSLVGGLSVENTDRAIIGKWGEDHPEVADLWIENHLEIRDFMEVPTE